MSNNAVPISAPGVAPLPPECFPKLLRTGEISMPLALWGVGITQEQATDLYYNLRRAKISGSISHYCGTVNYLEGGLFQECEEPTYWNDGDVVPPYPAVYDSFSTTRLSQSQLGSHPYGYDASYSLTTPLISATRDQIGTYDITMEALTDWESGPDRIYMPSSPWALSSSFLFSSASGYTATLQPSSRLSSATNNVGPWSWILNEDTTIWPPLDFSLAGPERFVSHVVVVTPACYIISGWYQAVWSYGTHQGQYRWCPIYTFHHLGDPTNSFVAQYGQLLLMTPYASSNGVNENTTQLFDLPVQWHGNAPFLLTVRCRVNYSGATLLSDHVYDHPITHSGIRLDLYPD